MRAVKVAYLPDPTKLASEAGYPSPALLDLLSSQRLSCFTLSPAQLLDGCLEADGYTLLCIPGGFAPNFARALGSQGKALIRSFVRGGGGFIGICAGAFYGSSIGLDLLPVDILDAHRWARGCGKCQMAFTPLAATALGSLGPSALLSVRYANGPLMQIVEGGSGEAQVHPLAHYASEFAAEELGGSSNFEPIMMGSPAAVIGYFGLGLVALVSPHIEDGDDERSRTPFCNLFRLCSRESSYQQYFMGSWGLDELSRRRNDAFQTSPLQQSSSSVVDSKEESTVASAAMKPHAESSRSELILHVTCKWTDRFREI